MDAGQDINSERYYHGVDIIALLIYILKRCWLIVIAAIIGAFAARFYVTNYVTPVYQATSKLYIAGSETSISITDLQLGSSLARDYEELFKISDIHERVSDNLGLSYSIGRLTDMVSVSVPSGSHVMYISVRSIDPEEARLLANTYAEVAQDYIANRMDMRRPLLIEEARKPGAPELPNVNASVKDGAVAGGFIPAILLVFLYLVNDRIGSADAIASAVNLPVFSSLPMLRSGGERPDSHPSPSGGRGKRRAGTVPCHRPSSGAFPGRTGSLPNRSTAYAPGSPSRGTA